MILLAAGRFEILTAKQLADARGTLVEMIRLIDELRQRFAIPTQSSVLAHVTTQLKALEAGAPVDLVFQSIAGTEAANRGFGIDLPW